MSEVKHQYASASPSGYEIFCPISATKGHKSGYLVGWRTNHRSCCVAGLVSDVALKDLQTALQILCEREEYSELWRYCKGTPVVLGHCITSTPASDSDFEIQVPDSERDWLVLEQSPDNVLFLQDFRSRETSKSEVSSFLKSHQIIIFQRPKRGSYLSVKPFSFDIASSTDSDCEKTELTDLEFSLGQINASSQLLQNLAKVLKTVQKRSSDLPKRDPTRRNCRTFTKWALMPIFLLLWCFRAFSEGLIRILNLHMPEFIGGGRLKERSSLMQQLDKRLVEICRWPSMWLQTRQKWKNNARASVAVLLFWGSVVRVFMDILFGLMMGLFMRYYTPKILMELHEAGQMLHLDVMRDNIRWFMGDPAGLKLNQALDQCLGSMVLFSIDFWDYITTAVTVWEPFLVYLFSFVGIFGASMVFAVLSDVLSLMTMHIEFVYTAFSKVYVIEIRVLRSLWMLFRGKKWNVLRERVDHCQFDMEQLIVGTIMFALSFFLLPTILVYFLFFSLVKLLVVLVKAAIFFFLFFFNYFPFFAFAVLIFDAGRLPGGIWFDVQQNQNQNSSDSSKRFVTASTYLVVRNSYLSISSLFYFFNQQLSLVFSHYSLPVILKSAFLGLKYPETPALEVENESQTETPKILSLSEFWQFLQDYWMP